MTDGEGAMTDDDVPRAKSQSIANSVDPDEPPATTTMYIEDNETCPRCREGTVIEVSDPSKVMELDEPVTVEKVCNSPGFGVYLHPVEEDQ